MKNFNLLVLASVLLINSLRLSAQTTGHSLEGRFTAASGNALEFVTVSLKHLPDSASGGTVITGSSGAFAFHNLAPGSYALSASLIGYKKTQVKVITIDEASPGSIQLGNLALEEDAKYMTGVTVTSKRPLVQRRLDKTIMNIENTTLATGNTAFELLQLAPGVSVINNDNIQLNGKGSPLIMIDGRPTYLSVDQLVNMLKSMPSDLIAEIEIISQPSSKYDAAGSSGIINIKMKRNKNLGLTGSASVAPGYGRKEKYRSTLNLGYRNKKYSASLDYAYSFNHSIRYLDVDRLVKGGSGIPTMFYGRSGRIDDRLGSHSFKAAFTYWINKNNTIGAQVQGYNNNERTFTDNHTDISADGRVLDSFLTSTSSDRAHFRNIGGNINYTGKLDSLGRELSFDADYSRFRTGVTRDLVYMLFNKYSGMLGTPDLIRNTFPTNIDVYSFKTDLSYPMKDHAKVEAGLKSSYVNTDNNAIYDSLINGAWINSTTQSNHFIYKENINAAYTNYQKEMGKFSFQGGLRLEQTNSSGNSVTLQKEIKRSYTDLFPSIFLGQDLKKNARLSFSYSRRIQRPSYATLNPFRFYDDPYTFREGNPYLKPAYTNSFELSSAFKKYYTVILSYAGTNNVIVEDIQQEQDPSGVSLTKSILRNIGHQNSYTLNMSFSKELTPWWSTDNSLILNQTNYEDSYQGEDRRLNNFHYTINTMQFFQINKTLTADVGGFYLSPWLYGFIKAREQYKLNIGFKKSIWNKKANLRLRVNDVFNTNRFSGTAVYTNVDVRILNRYETRTVFLTFTYIFGNKNVKVAKRQDTNTDVKGRVTSDNSQ